MSGRKGMSPIIRVFVFYSPRLGSICFGEEATISRSWRISKVVDRWLRSPVAKNHLVFEYQTQLGSRLAMDRNALRSPESHLGRAKVSKM